MKDAVAYIDTHFCDPDFSVKGLAADYKISVFQFQPSIQNIYGQNSFGLY